MVTCCPISDPFLDPHPYLPSQSELKAHLYGLIASLFTSSMIYGPQQGLVAGVGFVYSCVCFKMVDYLADSFLKGSIQESHLAMIKTALKTAGTVFAVIFSYVVLEYPIEAMAVSFMIYMVLSTCFKICDPLDLVTLCGSQTPVQPSTN